MIIKTCFFTGEGKEKAEELFLKCKDYTPYYKKDSELLSKWTKDGFDKHIPLLFVGACGIAVRTIAPYLKDKLMDSPVLVMDEKGQYVIPVLSGHLGGANELAKELATVIGGTPVITTATDIQNIFSVDVFAKKNGLQIKNREGIRMVTGKLLSGQKADISIDPTIETVMDGFPKELTIVPYPPEEKVDILITTDETYCANSMLLLTPKDMVLGIGCKKGKSFEDLKNFVEKHVDFSIEQKLYAISSIELKKHETGLEILAQFYHVPFTTYTIEELEAVKGKFSESGFVKQTTGVSNVCERSAMRCAGAFGKQPVLFQGKIAKEGMTLAVAKRVVCITTWET